MTISDIQRCPHTAHKTEYGIWQCILAAGHTGDCKANSDAAYYNQPVQAFEREKLAAELLAWIDRYEQHQKRWAADYKRLEKQHTELLRELVELAPANGTRRTVPAADVLRIWQEHI